MAITLRMALDRATAEEKTENHEDKGFTLRLTHSAVMLPLTMVSLAFMKLHKAATAMRRREKPDYQLYPQWLHATVKAEPSKRDENGVVTRIVRVSGLVHCISPWTIDEILAHEISESRCELQLDGESWIPVSVELDVIYHDESKNYKYIFQPDTDGWNSYVIVPV